MSDDELFLLLDNYNKNCKNSKIWYKVHRVSKKLIVLSLIILFYIIIKKGKHK